MKTIAYIILVIVGLSSCSGSKFLSRKYTAGVFTESHRSMKHNTIKVENNNIYASANSNLDLKKSNTISEVQTEKEIIETKANSIIKRDSIFHILKKGRDKIIIVKNNLPDVHVKVDERKSAALHLKEAPAQYIDSATKAEMKHKMAKTTWLALAFCLIPVAGMIFSKNAIHQIKKYHQYFPKERLTKYKCIYVISFIFTQLIFVGCLIGMFFVNFYLALVAMGLE